MSKLLKQIDRLVFLAIALLLAAMVLDVTIQVVFRYVIQNPPTWTEEAARFLCIWMVFLAAGLAFGRGSHIVVDALHLVLPLPLKRLLLVLINLASLAFLLVLVWQGVEMVQLTSNTTSTAMQLNMGVVYAALPTGSAIAALYVVQRLVDLVRGIDRVGDSTQTMVD